MAIGPHCCFVLWPSFSSCFTLLTMHVSWWYNCGWVVDINADSSLDMAVPSPFICTYLKRYIQFKNTLIGSTIRSTEEQGYLTNSVNIVCLRKSANWIAKLTLFLRITKSMLPKLTETTFWQIKLRIIKLNILWSMLLNQDTPGEQKYPALTAGCANKAKLGMFIGKAQGSIQTVSNDWKLTNDIWKYMFWLCMLT